MKNFIANLGYFLKEARRIIFSNMLSNIFTFLGTVLILLMLASVVTGWNIASRLVKMLEQEAEISVFFHEEMDEKKILDLTENLGKLDGVWNTRLVDESEAYRRMEEILGNDAGILELFEENPFKAYIEIRIDPGQLDTIVETVQGFKEIDFVRDNRSVLESINDIIMGIKTIGTLVIFAVGITTIIIISHMIRQGIFNNRDQIKTLRLLGASRTFIGFPFICVGLLITVAAGLLASLIMVLLIHKGYQIMGGSIPFIPLPPMTVLLLGVTLVIMGVSIILGMAGSLFGLSSIKEH
jgi:cell division transport system permease protein